ncbi:hypothetical protein F2P81_006824 [Scophthalmus maximus]|uniref:Uncharacterized protein n=1 Tax=Scophthalmus maximus TaxID=52904 RepID=A0A6A4T0A5_SCOMX|nr:hypothetical protein F2P81_006824 [Scophthalmus maximus]
MHMNNNENLAEMSCSEFTGALASTWSMCVRPTAAEPRKSSAQEAVKLNSISRGCLAVMDPIWTRLCTINRLTDGLTSGSHTRPRRGLRNNPLTFSRMKTTRLHTSQSHSCIQTQKLFLPIPSHLEEIIIGVKSSKSVLLNVM